MTEPIRVVLIDDHGLCRRGLSELLEQRAGLKVIGHADFVKYWEKWRAYVLQVNK